MPALGLSAAAVLVKGLIVKCDPRLPSRPKGVKLGKNRSIRSNYVELGVKKVSPVLGLLTGNNVQMAEWLAASVIGNPTVLLHAILYREDIYSGIPVVITEHDQLVADYSIVLSPTCYERPLTFELPVPQPASKKELNRFCRMAERHFGTDLVRFAETMTSMSMIDLDRLFEEQCAIFEGKDNLDDQFKTVCGAILTTMTIV